MSEQNTVQELLSTYVVIDNQAQYPISVELEPKHNLTAALALLREAYLVKYKDHLQYRLIITGMLDTLLAEAPHLNLNYDRSLKLGVVTLYYGKTIRQTPPADQPKDLSKYFVEPAAVNEPPADEFNLSALANIDFGAVEERVNQMQDGGGEVLDASDECEGGGCKI